MTVRHCKTGRVAEIKVSAAIWLLHLADYNEVMSTNSNHIFRQALSLPEGDRAALAASLLQSLDPEIDDDAGEIWDAEIKRRIDEIDNGAVELIPWAEVRKELRNIRNG